MAISYQDINVSIIEESVIVAEVEEVTIVADVAESFDIYAEVSEVVIDVSVDDEVIINAEVSETEVISVEVSGWSGGSGGSGSGAGTIFITRLTSSGIISDESYVPDTVPSDKVLLSATSDSDVVNIHFQAEGGENYSPVISIESVDCTNLQQVPGDLRIFTGSIPVTLTQETKSFILRSDTGFNATVSITRGEDAPSILSCVIGDYPDIQTAAKQGDTINVTGSVDSSATHVRILSAGAFVDSGWIACSGGTYSVSGVVSSQTGLHSCTIYSRNDVGSVGAEYTSDNQITLDQIAPSFVLNDINYPTGQLAFKGSESGTVDLTVNEYTDVTYSSPSFSISNNSFYEKIKTVACTNPGDYNDSTPNYTVHAVKTSNGTSNSFSLVLEVADIAPIMTVSQPYSRLRSSDAGTDYVITVTSNQNMLDYPDIGIPVSGTWKGTGFVGGRKVFTRTITIDDLDAKGTGSWILNSPQTNMAGLPATITGSQNVGGFVIRSYAIPAFGTTAWLGTEVVDTSKLILEWTVKSNMVFQPVSTPPPVVFGYTLASIGTNPTQIIILDTQAASSSSQESTITIEEVV